MEYLRIPVRPIKRESGPCSTQWETPLGTFWAKPDEGGLLSHLVNEELNEAVYNRPPVAVQAGDVVLDGGAHVGTFSKFALAHGARRVIAFEPDPVNADCLQRNLDSELRSGAVVVVRKALWNHSGALALSRGENSAQSKASDSVEAPTGESIPAITIDEAVRVLRLDRVDFIKLDIEGAERKAIEGAAETLRRFRPRMVLCTYHRPDDPVKITEAVLRVQPFYWVFASSKQAYFYEGEGEASRRGR
jgi:FkbM family methyltransferase